ncbi:alginate export family protein [Arenibacter sp. S6351L]|uniref:alginate export family protein n=1 Tax=Arenibacter sp. S6351L TaxID=2926407 RepID=UPI001FF5DDC6|nr:alginate export family protein [Arenibacter sp. S6351L]MCK0133058.1 alginate export family protein [Arenibacter sp. S6351L]
MKLKKPFKVLFFILLSTQVKAQLAIDAELRPRFEYRHGFKTLFPNNEDPAVFVSQRTRLNTNYEIDRLSFYLSLQDVRIWGDVPQLNSSDKNGVGIHQAWGKIKLDPTFFLKVGRQEIIYDDHRIFGDVGWAQQARSHDAARVEYNNAGLKIDLGFAFNQSDENLTGNTLTTPGTYKSIQYLWAHNEWNKFSASFLFLNNGLQFIDDINSNNNQTRYSQTLGTHLNYKANNLKLTSNLYYQFGKDIANNDLNAYLISLEGNYKIAAKSTLGLGVELISGNDNGSPSNQENKAFTPLYGTNHKFNGLMDYFYVGNHTNSVGLLDIYANAKVALNEKSNVNIALHNFSAAAEIGPNSEKQLGTELDIVYAYKLQKEIGISGGYSHLFASQGMETIKGNFDGNINNWGWIMLTINPILFSNKD